jgi:hypothetical protein
VPHRSIAAVGSIIPVALLCTTGAVLRSPIRINA